MFSRLLAVPIIVGLLTFFYLYQTHDDFGSIAIYIVPFVIVGVMLYLFSPQLDWWWYKRNPPDLAQPLRLLLVKHNTYYNHLSVEEKLRFRQRMKLYMIANEYKPMGGGEAVPEDIKAFIAAAAIQVTFGQNDYLMAPFEHIIVYPNLFPSPQYPEHFHPSEIYAEDGVIMVSGNYLMQAVIQPKKIFHIGLYEYAKIFMRTHLNYTYPERSTIDWETLEKVSGMSKAYLDKFMNLPEIDPLAVSIHHFFQFPAAFKQHLPDLYEQLSVCLNQDTFNIYQPVIQAVQEAV